MRLVLYALAGWVLLAPAARADRAPLRTLTSLAEIRGLTPGEATLGYPVMVRGQITLMFPALYLNFLQDATDSIYLSVPPLHPQVQAGDLVEVTGVTDKGSFSPLISVQFIRVVGHASLPQPRKPKAGDLGTGRLDSAYTEIEGELRAYHKSRSDEPGGDGFLRLFLLTRFGRYTVVLLVPAKVDFARVVGSHIRVRGVVGVTANQQNQLTDEYLLVGRSEDLEVIAAHSNPAETKLLNIWELMQFHSAGEVLSRVRVQGTLTLIRSHRYLVLQRGDRGVMVNFDQRETFPLGATLEATGFPATGGYSPILTDGLVRLLSPGAPLPPVETDAASAARGEHDLALIRLKAEVVAYVHDRDRQALWLRSGPTTFSTILDDAQPRNALDNMKTGSEVEVTGVCSNLISEQTKELIGFRLLLRSDKDVTVLNLPRWWLRKQVLEALGLTLIPILLVLIWNTVLRRRVRTQTALIEKRAAFDRECAEVLEMVGRNEGLALILKKICRLLESQLPGCCCVIRRVEDDQGPCGAEPDWNRSVSISSSEGKTLGTCALSLPRSRHWGEADETVLESAVSLAGVAIEHRQLCDRLTRQSRQDGLTGLANRLELEERFAESIERGRRYDHYVACLYIDLDGFKQVNDRFGHSAGDVVLQCAGIRIQALLRNTDTLARMGGDEFCIVIPEAEHFRTAESVAAKLIEVLEQPIPLEGELVKLSASVGISYFPVHGDNVTELQRRADTAMYRAKRSGKGRYLVFGEEEKGAPEHLVATGIH